MGTLAAINFDVAAVWRKSGIFTVPVSESGRGDWDGRFSMEGMSLMAEGKPREVV
jgi:hypothetical protein